MTLAAMGCLIVLYAATMGENSTGGRIALAIGSEIERLARPETAPPPTTSVLRPAATGERLPAPHGGLSSDEPRSADAEDELRLDDPFTEEQLHAEPFDVVITVDGEPARGPDERVAGPQLASLGAHRVATPIPNPQAALLQKTPLGRIPKVAADGRRSQSVYAKAAAGGEGEARVSLIVSGLGLDLETTARAIEELPAAVTLSFAPYAKDLETWTAEARAAGHEIMVELPMEAYGGGAEALGPAALLTSRTAAENLQRLDWLLSRFGAYFAATNYQGSKFSADRAQIGAVLSRLDALGVAYFDDTGAARIAAGESAPVATVDRMLAAKPGSVDAKALKRDLAALEALARKDGAALGKTFARHETLDAIIEWSKGLGARGAALAPASSMLLNEARTARG